MEGTELQTLYNVTNKEINLDELQGDAEFIAKRKVKEAAKHVDTPAITEDVSLCFNALKGLPGPYMYLDFSKIILSIVSASLTS